MEWLLFWTLWGLIGSVVGRMLFRVRLGNSSRYFLGRQVNEWNQEIGPIRAIDTDDMTSAKTYGLWSIPLWPLTAAIFLIQAPTPQERQVRREIELQELLDKADAIVKELR